MLQVHVNGCAVSNGRCGFKGQHFLTFCRMPLWWRNTLLLLMSEAQAALLKGFMSDLHHNQFFSFVYPPTHHSFLQLIIHYQVSVFVNEATCQGLFEANLRLQLSKLVKSSRYLSKLVFLVTNFLFCCYTSIAAEQKKHCPSRYKQVFFFY